VRVSLSACVGLTEVGCFGGGTRVMMHCKTQIVVLANYWLITVACYPSHADSKNAVVINY